MQYWRELRVVGRKVDILHELGLGKIDFEISMKAEV